MKKPTINLTEILTFLVAEIIKNVKIFSHIDLKRTLVCVSSNRGGRGAIYGKLVPLRFENGKRVVRHRGRLFSIPAVMEGNTEILYIVYFYMPRFFDLPAREKLNVIFHELYHISPEFNGDIRRMGKVKAAHGHSRDHFNSQFSENVDDFFKQISGTPYMNFLSMNSSAIFSNFARVKGRRMKAPRPVEVTQAAMRGEA